MMKTLRLFTILLALAALGSGSVSASVPGGFPAGSTPSASSSLALAPSSVVANEGAWCWFADPRALHYENAAGTINATYLGYIDVHGNVKATQYDWVSGRKTDVLVRSYFQPDDHNNPTFLVLPDERVMVFYTRHTDEPRIWYRISKNPGDITALGEEKYLVTANNTTYPSPFILSDDPQHIYLCWRGINWHPTIARLTMPDADDNCQFDFGPKQIVQSTGARPYAKYQSNGKDKIYVSYTTGHPDNEMPDWLYFNVIDVNGGNGPILRDLNRQQLSVVQNGPFNVSKTDSYAKQHPATIVDKTASIRNWVWQIALDKDEHPVIAYPHIDDAKTSHVYWYARWNGTAWKNTWVTYGGHAFHQNWNSTERCYSGGMSLDPDNINDLYLSIPTKDGAYNKDGVYEIWRYTIDDEGMVTGSEQLTKDSPKNNVRPFVIPGSKNSPLRVAWMQGDYYYWMVNKNYPKGYPTALHCDYDWQEEPTVEHSGYRPTCLCFGKNQTITIAFVMDTQNYDGVLFSINGEKPLVYSISPEDQRPEITYDGVTYKSQNRLLTSDGWAYNSSGTNSDNHPTKLATWVLTMTYDGSRLTTYRNGFVDQVVEIDGLDGDYENGALDGSPVEGNVINSKHRGVFVDIDYVCHSPLMVQQKVREADSEMQGRLNQAALDALQLPAETRTDLVLPAEMYQRAISWTSSNERIINADGVLDGSPVEDNIVTLTAHCGDLERSFEVKALARDIAKNLRYELGEVLDMTANTATGFATNTFGLAPEGLLNGLRSYTVLATVNAKSLSGQPRVYDFGSGSGNSLFLRANPLAAGIKYNGGTTTMVNGNATLRTDTEYKLAVSFDAATRTTTIYVNGKLDAGGTVNQNEAYMLYELAADSRNYIGRTQWWDSSYAKDNQDFQGTISSLKLYDACLTRAEICQLQGIDYEQENLPSALINGDFEGSYSVQAGSGVSSDRAIYVPEGWTVERLSGNENDITALTAGDFYFDRFFGALPASAADSHQSYWIRQNWGTPTLTLTQRLRLRRGSYVLTADLWKSGLGGDATVSVATEGGATVSSPTLENKTEWQRVELPFTSNGDAATTVTLKALHNSSGSEKIIGFDNVRIAPDASTGISVDGALDGSPVENYSVYDLTGRRLSAVAFGRQSTHFQKGIYVMDGRKFVVR